MYIMLSILMRHFSHITQSNLSILLEIINSRETSKTTASAQATSTNGAHGPILSKIMPPTRANMVVPIDPKKKASPESVPRICAFIFLMNSTSTQMN